MTALTPVSSSNTLTQTQNIGASSTVSGGLSQTDSSISSSVASSAKGVTCWDCITSMLRWVADKILCIVTFGCYRLNSTVEAGGSTSTQSRALTTSEKVRQQRSIIQLDNYEIDKLEALKILFLMRPDETMNQDALKQQIKEAVQDMDDEFKDGFVHVVGGFRFTYADLQNQVSAVRWNIDTLLNLIDRNASHPIFTQTITALMGSFPKYRLQVIEKQLNEPSLPFFDKVRFFREALSLHVEEDDTYGICFDDEQIEQGIRDLFDKLVEVSSESQIASLNDSIAVFIREKHEAVELPLRFQYRERGVTPETFLNNDFGIQVVKENLSRNGLNEPRRTIKQAIDRWVRDNQPV